MADRSIADLRQSLAGLSKSELLAIRRDMAETAAKMGARLNDASSPGQLALRHEPLIQVQRPHLEVIDAALVSVLHKPKARVLITTPPQVGKTMRASNWFPFWWLTMRPRDPLILASYSASHAMRQSAIVRSYVRDYGANYGLRLSPESATQSRWYLTTGGGMRAGGVGTGLSGTPMALGIIDDPYADRAQAESLLIRNKVWDWYSSVWTARRAPETREILIMTRWHPDDLAGRLLAQDGRIEEGGDWVVVHLPAIAMAENHELGVWADPLGRQPGEPLTHPAVAPDDTVTLLDHWREQKSRATGRDWRALWQGTPIATDGALLTADDMRNQTRPRPETFKRVSIGVDPSGGGRDSAGLVAVGLGEDGRAWVVEDRTARMTSFEWPKQACLMAHRHDAGRIVVETNFGGDQATTLIMQAWQVLLADGEVDGLCPYVEAVRAKVSKVLRAEPIAQAIKTDRVRFAAGADLKQLTTDWTIWEPGSTFSPGALDASVYAVMDVLPALNRGATIESPTGRRRGQAGGNGGGFSRRRSA
ncbi:terminase large subunit [Gordonia phage Lilbeanie]|uniref:Terminase large subunit n=1 Tax=Gordonia phage Lilbeanie TaxID=2794947 RepID=A0A7T1KS81_9CAUD|nr:terminase large subunit [Gordonia phage Lilbeanie]QPO17081.1 terminase large subunit [Gordonia phage Lilbeanie]